MERHMTDEISDSPSGEELDGEGNLKGSGPLNKGSWISSEDAILADYVQKHGEGNWNAVQKFSGLSRCGKSCRLRWVNHLKSNLKKGAFSLEEERKIIELHAKLGNKWARMAAELPGRTDNDIKNFWNTRIKKLQRAGLPIYPPDVCLKKANDSQESPDSGTLSDDLTSGHYFMEASNFVIPEFKIERPLNLRLYSYPSPFLDSPTSNTLPQGLDPSCCFSYTPPTVHPQKRPPESNNTPPRLCNTDAWEKQHPPYQLPPPPESHSCADPSLCFPVVSHALINGTPSTFEPDFGSVKLELPSLQSLESDLFLWDASATPILSLEDSDPLAQFTQAGTNPLHQYTPDTDGLLESVICPPKSAKSSKFEFSETYPEHKTTGDGDDLYFDFSGNELEASAGHITPMDASIPSIFSDFTTSINELQSTDVGPESETLCADFEQYLTRPNMNGNSDPYQLDPSRPDTWFNANLLSPNSEQGRNYHTLQQALSAIAGNDTQQLQP